MSNRFYGPLLQDVQALQGGLVVIEGVEIQRYPVHPEGLHKLESAVSLGDRKTRWRALGERAAKQLVPSYSSVDVSDAAGCHVPYIQPFQRVPHTLIARVTCDEKVRVLVLGYLPEDHALSDLDLLQRFGSVA